VLTPDLRYSSFLLLTPQTLPSGPASSWTKVPSTAFHPVPWGKAMVTPIKYGENGFTIKHWRAVDDGQSTLSQQENNANCFHFIGKR
jgi:hypothetical protein